MGRQLKLTGARLQSLGGKWQCPAELCLAGFWHDGAPWIFRAPQFFEIEGVGIRTVGGVRTMWFNTQERGSTGGIYTATRRP